MNITLHYVQEEEKKESETSSKPSEAESSEDDDEDLPLESEDPLGGSTYKQALSGMESIPNSPASVTLG